MADIGRYFGPTFIRIGCLPLMDTSEARYAEMARKMVELE